MTYCKTTKYISKIIKYTTLSVFVLIISKAQAQVVYDVREFGSPSTSGSFQYILENTSLDVNRTINLKDTITATSTLVELAKTMTDLTIQSNQGSIFTLNGARNAGTSIGGLKNLTLKDMDVINFSKPIEEIFSSKTSGGFLHLTTGTIINPTNINIDNVYFINNQSLGDAGGVFQQIGNGYLNFNVEDSRFDGNTAATTGGAISLYNAQYDLKFYNTDFINNTAGTTGGALALTGASVAPGSGKESKLFMSNVNFLNNKAIDGGGAFTANSGMYDITWNGGSAIGNSSEAKGGVAQINAFGIRSGNLKISDVIFSQNSSKGSGGAITLWNGAWDVVIENVTFGGTGVSDGNIAQGTGTGIIYGGAAHLDDMKSFSMNGDVGSTGINSIAQNNQVIRDVSGGQMGGGAIYLKGAITGTASISNYNFINNAALGNNSAQGGAIYNALSGNALTISNSLFKENTATRAGAAIYSSNLSTINFSGNNIFEDNLSEGGSIRNDGTINITGKFRIQNTQAKNIGENGIAIANTKNLSIIGQTSFAGEFAKDFLDTNDWSVIFQDNSINKVTSIGYMYGSAIQSNGSDASISVDSTLFKNNSVNANATGAPSSGGGTIYIGPSSTASSISNSMFSNNSMTNTSRSGASNILGYVLNVKSAQLDINNTNFSNNTGTAIANGYRGANPVNASASGAINLSGDNAKLNVVDSWFEGNISKNEGDENTSKFIQMGGSVFSNNITKELGDTYAKFTNSSFIDNEMHSLGSLAGGGVMSNINGNMQLNKTTFSGNQTEVEQQLNGGVIGNISTSEGATSDINDSSFINNTVLTSLGKVYGGIIANGVDVYNLISYGSATTITNSEFTGNKITADKGIVGGIIYNLKNSMTIANAKFYGNILDAISGDILGGTIYQSENAGQMNLTNVSGSASIGTDGAFLYNADTKNVLNISSSDTPIDGYVTPSLASDLTQSIFSANQATSNGGAIYNSGFINAVASFISNKAKNGGAVYSSKSLDAANSIFKSNNATENGGAIYNTGSLTVTDSNFNNNTATENGGAIYNTGSLTITDSLFSNNSALTSGGAIHNIGTAYIVSQEKDFEFAGTSDTIYTTNNLYLNAMKNVILNGDITGSSTANLYLNSYVLDKSYGTTGNINLNSTLSGFDTVYLNDGTLNLGNVGKFGLYNAGVNLTMGPSAIFNAANGKLDTIYINNINTSTNASSYPIFNVDLELAGAVQDPDNEKVYIGTSDIIELSGTQSGILTWDSLQILNPTSYVKPTDFKLIAGNGMNLDDLKVIEGYVDTENSTFKIIQNPSIIGGTRGNNWIRLVNTRYIFSDPLRNAIYLTYDDTLSGRDPEYFSGQDAQFAFVLGDDGKIINYIASDYIEVGKTSNNVADMPIIKLDRTPASADDYVALTISGYIGSNYLLQLGNTNRDSILDASGFALLTNNSILNINNVTIKNAHNNDIFENGTAVYNTGRFNTKNVLFTNNQSVNGGAIYNANISNPLLTMNVNMIDTDFVSNNATADGGAFYNANGNNTTVKLTNSKFTSNSAAGNGGAIYNALGASMNIDFATFLDNTSGGLGEAIYNAGTMSITDSIFNFTTNSANGSSTIHNTGTLSLNTESKNAIFDKNTSDAISNSGTVNINVTGGYTMTFNNAIKNTATGNIYTNGDINLNSNLNGGTANLISGIFKVSSVGDINVANTNLSTGSLLKIDTTSAKTITSLGNVITNANAIIDMKNGHTGDIINMNNLTGTNVANIGLTTGGIDLDIDFANQSSDKINIQNTASGVLTVSSINILNEPDYNSMDPTAIPPELLDRMEFNIMNGANLSGLNLSTLTAGSTYTNYDTSYVTSIENKGTSANLILEKASTSYSNPLDNAVALANLYNKGWMLNVNSDITSAADNIALNGTMFVVGNNSSSINGAGNIIFTTNIGSTLNIVNAIINNGSIENNGSLSISDTSLSNVAINNNNTNTAANIVTVNKNTVFDNTSLTGDFKLTANNGHNIVLKNDFSGTGNINLAGNIKLTGDATNYTGATTINNANIFLDGGKFFGGEFIVNGVSSLSLVNSNPENWRPHTLDTSKWTLNSNLNTIMNVDLIGGTSDKFSGQLTDGTGIINITGINLISNKTGQADFEIADAGIKESIKLDENFRILNSIYDYKVTYSDLTGILSFLGKSIDSEVEGSVTGGNSIGALGALRTYANVFNRVNKLSTKGSEDCQPNKKYWVEGGADWDNIDLQKGPEVSGDMQNITIGVDSGMRCCGQKIQTYGSLYMGSITTDQKYDGNSIKGTGGYAGIMGTHIRENWISSITLTSGYTNINTTTSKKGFGLYNTGIAAKTGYNIPLDNFVLTPSAQTGYTHIFSTSYKTNNNVNVSSDSFGSIHIKPELKLSAKLKDNLNPYISTSYIYNTSVGGNPKANGISLPETELGSYFEYKLGIEKTWDKNISAYFEGALRSGSIEGGSVNMGVSVAF